MSTRRRTPSATRTAIAVCTSMLLWSGIVAAAQAQGTGATPATARAPQRGTAASCGHAARRRGTCVVHSKVGASHASKHASTRHASKTNSVSIEMTPVPVKNSPPVPSTASLVMPAAATAGSSPCADGNLIPGATNLPQVEAATVCLVNQVRAQHDLPALVVDPRLQTSAQQHNEDMVTQDYFAHVGPDGDTPLSRIQAAGYGTNTRVGYLLGENIAWGTLTLATPTEIVTAWVNSPDHLANILERDYTVTGLAVAPEVPSAFAEGQAGAMYTQDFGGVQAAG